jgi:hypothetical protein
VNSGSQYISEAKQKKSVMNNTQFTIKIAFITICFMLASSPLIFAQSTKSGRQVTGKWRMIKGEVRTVDTDGSGHVINDNVPRRLQNCISVGAHSMMCFQNEPVVTTSARSLRSTVRAKYPKRITSKSPGRLRRSLMTATLH